MGLRSHSLLASGGDTRFHPAQPSVGLFPQLQKELRLLPATGLRGDLREDL